MALRRSVVDLVGPFDDALDAGTPTHSGGESELMARIIAGGYRIVYTPSALNWHRHRRSLPELRRTIYGYGAGVYAFWTSYTLKQREWAAPLVAGKWFWYDQLPALLRSAARVPGAPRGRCRGTNCAAVRRAPGRTGRRASRRGGRSGWRRNTARK